MQELLERLFNLMAHELEKYNELLKILYRERQILVERKTSELAELVHEEEVVIDKIAGIETARDELLVEILAQPETGDQELSAAKIIDLADEPLKSDYVDLFNEIGKVKREFELVNETNKALLKSESDYVSFLMEQITKIGEPGDTYADDGHVRLPKSKGLFDHQI